MHKDIQCFLAEQEQFYRQVEGVYNKLTEEIFRYVLQKFPNITGTVYGSFRTELIMPWSDIDIVFQGTEQVNNEVYFLSELANIFQGKKDLI